MIENKIYYVEQIHSSKAYQFTSYYHYSGLGIKQAKYNLGIFRKENNLLVGVLQFGLSYKDNIRLDRYIKDKIDKEEYLELNRFCMADSEGKNAESQAIALGIKWIKTFVPYVRLLVSYAGRKEGNYGYIYQATNWEYLGYFVSPGFWLIDGAERHQVGLWYWHKKHGNTELSLSEDLCAHYSDVRRTETKQFIYVMRLDPTLTLANEILPYPKPATEYPIMTKCDIYKQNDEVFNSYKPQRAAQEPQIYYTDEEYYFTKRTMIRSGVIIPDTYAMYDTYGVLEETAYTMKELGGEEYKPVSISNAIKNNKVYKNKYFRLYKGYDLVEEEIEVPAIAIIDEIPFPREADIADYLHTTRQAVSAAKKKQSTKICGKEIEWLNI